MDSDKDKKITETNKQMAKDEGAICITPKQVDKLVLLRLASWYGLSLVIYIFCIVFGFGLAFYIVMMITKMKVWG